MKTIAECVGGPCDGMQFDPPDPEEPDDWPDHITLTSNEDNKPHGYELREWKAEVRKGVRVYRYVYDDLPYDGEE